MEVVRTIVEVPERGHVDFDQRSWAAIRDDDALWSLFEAKILTQRPIAGKAMRIAANGYIGEAIIGSYVFRLVEKTPGAAATLLALASDDAFKLRDQERMATAPADLLRLIIARYAQLVSSYCSAGRDLEYAERTVVAPRMSGRLLVPLTTRLHSGGRTNVVACRKFEPSYDTPFNRAIYAGLRQAERLSHKTGASLGTIMSVRAMATIFQHITDAETLTSPELRMRKITQLIARERDSFRGTLLRTAALLLSGESIERKDYRNSISPVTWFIALHGLFEEAIYRALSKAISGWASLSRRVSNSGPVFLFDNTDFKVNPDLVVTPVKGEVLVGDIKYKNLEGMKPVEDDIYQLVAHASAFRSKFAFLIFPGESFSQRVVGTTVAGLTVQVFTVSLLSFADDLQLVAAALRKTSNAL